MKQVVIIGTIHLNTTPADELIEEITKHQPDKVLIELSPHEVEQGPEESIRDEMFAALDWCKETGTAYEVFDVEVNILKLGVTGNESDFLAAEQEVKTLLQSGYDWKALNDKRMWEQGEVKELNGAIIKKYFDPIKMKERNRLLEQNIKSQLIDGVNMIVTGSAHIPDFLKAFPGSVAPLVSQVD